ncbi:MAG TPA: response regulator [Gammaproteobacteria bacterium]|nr:response regulator [Gammaproteobacteria bacterium]
MSILVVEDNPNDVFILQKCFELLPSPGKLIHQRTAMDALSYLQELHDKNALDEIQLILLDLNLPGIDGRGFLKEMKTNDRFKSIPVIILSTSNNYSDVAFCYAQGANCYLQKPFDFDDMKILAKRIDEFWLHTAILP